jgi:hypothetical protein
VFAYLVVNERIGDRVRPGEMVGGTG